MDLGTLFIVLSIFVVVAVIAVKPFLFKVQDQDHPHRHLFGNYQDQLALAENRKNLKKLELDYRSGKISDSTFNVRRQNLELSAKDLPYQIGAGEESLLTGNSDTSDQIEAMLEKRRMSRSERSSGFCPRCGKPIQKSDLYCPFCGHEMR